MTGQPDSKTASNSGELPDKLTLDELATPHTTMIQDVVRISEMLLGFPSTYFVFAFITGIIALGTADFSSAGTSAGFGAACGLSILAAAVCVLAKAIRENNKNR